MKIIYTDTYFYWIKLATDNFVLDSITKGEIVILKNMFNENKKVIFLGKTKGYTFKRFDFFDFEKTKILRTEKFSI